MPSEHFLPWLFRRYEASHSSSHLYPRGLNGTRMAPLQMAGRQASGSRLTRHSNLLLTNTASVWKRSRTVCIQTDPRHNKMSGNYLSGCGENLALRDGLIEICHVRLLSRGSLGLHISNNSHNCSCIFSHACLHYFTKLLTNRSLMQDGVDLADGMLRLCH